jgi:hypothetical protein
VSTLFSDLEGQIGPTGLPAGQPLERVQLSGVVLANRNTPLTRLQITFDNVVITSPISWPVSGANAAGVQTGGAWLELTLTSGAAYTLNAVVTNLTIGQVCALKVKNASGGAAGVMTFGTNFKTSAVTQPANGNSRTYFFIFDGTNLVEAVKSAADVPN